MPVRTVDLTADSPGEPDVGQTAKAEEMVEPAMGPTEEVAPTTGEGATPRAAEGEAPPATEGVEGAGSTGGPAMHEPAATSAGGIERAEGSETPVIPSRPSLMNQGRRAERLMKQVCLPEFQAKLYSQSAEAFFREAYVAQLWVSFWPLRPPDFELTLNMTD